MTILTIDTAMLSTRALEALASGVHDRVTRNAAVQEIARRDRAAKARRAGQA